MPYSGSLVEYGSQYEKTNTVTRRIAVDAKRLGRSILVREFTTAILSELKAIDRYIEIELKYVDSIETEREWLAIVEETKVYVSRLYCLNSLTHAAEVFSGDHVESGQDWLLDDYLIYTYQKLWMDVLDVQALVCRRRKLPKWRKWLGLLLVLLKRPYMLIS